FGHPMTVDSRPPRRVCRRAAKSYPGKLAPSSTTTPLDVRFMAGQAVQAMAGQAVPAEAEIVEEIEAVDRPWVTVVWDDPVNLMHYVTFIFQNLFGYSKAKATELMFKVHNDGTDVVSSGSCGTMDQAMM